MQTRLKIVVHLVMEMKMKMEIGRSSLHWQRMRLQPGRAWCVGSAGERWPCFVQGLGCRCRLQPQIRGSSRSAFQCIEKMNMTMKMGLPRCWISWKGCIYLLMRRTGWQRRAEVGHIMGGNRRALSPAAGTTAGRRRWMECWDPLF